MSQLLNYEIDLGTVKTITGDAGGAISPDAAHNIGLTGIGAVTVTGAPLTNSLEISVSGGGLPWTEVAGIAQALAVDNGYILNNAARVTATLPAVAAVGEIIAIAGSGAGGWKIAQNAGQTIHFSVSDSTPGVGGYLESTNRYDCVEMVCITANTDFLVRSGVGNVTIV